VARYIFEELAKMARPRGKAIKSFWGIADRDLIR